MKKIITLVACLLCLASVASAQTFSNGTQVLNAGLGVGGDYGTPIAVSYEQGVYDIASDQSIGVGGFVGYAASSEDFLYGEFKYSNIFIAAMANYHYTGFNNWDLYGGVRLGYNAATSSTEWVDPSNESLYGDVYSASAGGIIYTAHIGARYYFSDNFGVNAELGYGIASLTIGVAYKF